VSPQALQKQLAADNAAKARSSLNPTPLPDLTPTGLQGVAPGGGGLCELVFVDVGSNMGQSIEVSVGGCVDRSTGDDGGIRIDSPLAACLRPSP
jgi:hypothetical protein